MVFYKQVLEFHCPSNLCQTPRRQNHWSLPYTNLCCSLSCFWTCMYYSSLCHLWTVDISVLHQTVLPGWVFSTETYAASGGICFKAACAAPGRYSSIAVYAVPGHVCVSLLQYSSLHCPRTCLSCSSLCFTWTSLFNSSLYCARRWPTAACGAP